MNTELHLKYRPTTLEQIVGQSAVVKQLKSFLQPDEITLPHTILLEGQTGTGKTTTARILARYLGCPPNESNPNYIEKNCADCRSIDDVRAIREATRYSAMGGTNVRIWVLDEVVQLPTATQQAFLKILEEPPSHVYFFLCASHTDGLHKTFKDRCHPIIFQLIPKTTLVSLAMKIAIREGQTISQAVGEAIGENAAGSARQALQLLESALSCDSDEEQLKAVQGSADESQAIDIARAIHKRASESELMKLAGLYKGSPESLRWKVLGYTNTVMIRNPTPASRAYCNAIISRFRDSWNDCGASGLLSALYEISRMGRK